MALDFRDKDFDAVVSGEVLEHIENDMHVVKEFYRALKEGGVCIITVPANQRLWDKNDEWAGHHRRYDRAQLRHLFEGAGFEIIRCTHWGFPLIRLFHKYIYLPMVDRKILKERKNISKERGPLYRCLKNKHLHRIGAVFFSFDNLFNFLPFGIGLFLIARKP
jgi:SAM-dependent methyltransferase